VTWSADINGSARSARFADDAAIDAHTVILATGVSYRQLTAPGVEELTGRGVYYGSALTEAVACTGQDVFIVGGANSAGQAAVHLSRGAKSVTLLVRGPSLQKSMSYYLIQQIAGIGSISVRACTEVIAAHGSDHLESLTLRDSSTGGTETVDAQVLFVFIGAAPLTDWLDGVVVRDSHGFVVAVPEMNLAFDRSWRVTDRGDVLETKAPAVRNATQGPNQPNASPPPSARAPSPSCSCTATWRSSDDRARAVAAVQHRRAAHAVLVREADRRAAGVAVQPRARGTHRARAGVRGG
jgi:hypothetical protein